MRIAHAITVTLLVEARKELPITAQRLDSMFAKKISHSGENLADRRLCVVHHDCVSCLGEFVVPHGAEQFGQFEAAFNGMLRFQEPYAGSDFLGVRCVVSHNEKDLPPLKPDQKAPFLGDLQ